MVDADGHHDHSRRDILLDIATPELYRANAFRVLGLSMTVDGAEISRRQKKLKVLEKLGGTGLRDNDGILPLTPPPDSDMIRRAGQRLHDMQSRLVDEIFWFWPSMSDPTNWGEGYACLQAGEVSNAHRAWSSVPSDHQDWPTALHNLAVMHHALALDLELVGDGQTGADTNLAARRERHWKVALRCWSMSVDNAATWGYVSVRAKALEDPRLTSGFVKRLREALPSAILAISIALAVRAAKRDDADEAKRHLKYVRESGFDLQLAASLLEREVSPLFDQVRSICERFEEKSKKAPATADQLTKTVLSDCKPLLRAIQTVLNKGHHLRHRAFNLVASTVRSCMICYGNETEDWEQCIRVLKDVESLPEDEELRSRIRQDIVQTEENKKGKENEEALRLVNEAFEAAEDGRPEAGRRMLSQALAACRDPDLREQISGLVRQVDDARRIAARRGWLRELGSPAIRLAVVTGIIALIGWLGDSCETRPSRSRSPSTSPSRIHSSPQPPASTLTYTGLSSKIDSGKARVRLLETELDKMDTELDSLSSDIDNYKPKVERYENEVKSGLPVNETLYQQTIDAHNRLVKQYNSLIAERSSLLADRNMKYNEYKREIDSVNDMVRRYNRGER